MEILFYPPTGEVALSGDAAELRRLSALIAQGAGRYETDNAESPDGQVALTAVCVRTVDAGAVHISVDAEARCLCVVGDLDRLRVLADSLVGVAEMDDGGHIHLDYYPDHPYLAPGPVELVVNSPHGGMPSR